MAVTRFCFVCLAVVVFLRRPEQLLHPQLWAEDGGVFLKQAWDHGLLWTLTEPFSGYLHTFPRLAAGISLLFPLERAPLVFNALAFLAQIAPLHYLLSDRMRAIVPSFPVRLLAAFLLAAAPNSYPTYVNITNSQSNLALAAVLILLSRAPASRLAAGFDLALLILFSLTGPFSIMLLPLLPLLLRPRADAGWRTGRQAPAAIVVAGAVVQMFFALGSPRVGGFSTASLPSLRETLTILSLHVFYAPVLGIGGTTRLLRWLTLPAILLGLLVVAGFAFIALRRKAPALLVLLYLATVTIVLSFLFPLNDLRLWLQPAFGPRYYYFATLFVIFSALYAAADRGFVRFAGLAVLGAVLLVAVPADFFHPRLNDAHFADQVAVFNSLPQGADFFFPLNPTIAFTGMTLRKKSAVQGPSPLSRLKSVPAAARVSVDTVTGLTVQGVDFVQFSGWAVDDAAGKPAGGVYLRVDDKLFPAVYGERRPEFAGPGRERALLHSGFVRYLPVSEIGRGSHRALLVVLTADEKAYFHPSGAVTIPIP